MSVGTCRVRTLEFENAHFLQSLFAGEAGLLKVVARTFGLKVTTRDNWIKFESEDDARDRESGSSYSSGSRSARRDGAEISEHSFRFALDAVAQGEGEALKELMAYRLLGTSTKPPVVPKTRGQLEYLKAMDQERRGIRGRHRQAPARPISRWRARSLR